MGLLKRRKPITDWPLEVGDIVFILMDIPVFRQVAKDTGSWTNHVGIVVDVSGKEPLVAESKFPFSTIRPLSKFLAASGKGRVEIKRFRKPLSEDDRNCIKAVAKQKLGILYDPWFNLRSHRQFCSRFVHEVVRDATGRSIGNVETLRDLLSGNPDANLLFWRLWYFGKIPWERETVTPASILNDDSLRTIVSGKKGNYRVDLPQPAEDFTT